MRLPEDQTPQKKRWLNKQIQQLKLQKKLLCPDRKRTERDIEHSGIYEVVSVLFESQK